MSLPSTLTKIFMDSVCKLYKVQNKIDEITLLDNEVTGVCPQVSVQSPVYIKKWADFP